MNDRLFRKGDKAVLIIISVPALQSQLVSIVIKDKVVVKAGEKQFSFGNRNHKQADVGTIVAGITYYSYTIVVPKGESEDKYLKLAFDKIQDGALKVKERCAQIIEKTNEGLVNLDMMNIKRN